MKAIIFLVCCGLLCLIPANGYSSSEKIKKVVEVVDGDTVLAEDNYGTKFMLSIFGVDAPEKGQPYYQEAAAFVRDRINAGCFYGEAYTAKTENKYKAVDIYCKDQAGVIYQNLATMIIQAGLGYYDRSMYLPGIVNHRMFISSEEMARQSAAGVWSKPNQFPWDYRWANKVLDDEEVMRLNLAENLATAKESTSMGGEPTSYSECVARTMEGVSGGGLGYLAGLNTAKSLCASQFGMGVQYTPPPAIRKSTPLKLDSTDDKLDRANQKLDDIDRKLRTGI